MTLSRMWLMLAGVAAIVAMLLPARQAVAQTAPAPGVLEGVVLAPSSTGTATPVEGAAVRVFAANVATPVREGRTNERGGFSFDTLRPGAYRVVAFKEGVGEGSAGAMLTEKAGARVRIMLMPPRPPPIPAGTILGTVYVRTNTGVAPVEGATVRLVSMSPSPTPPPTTTSNREGHFRFADQRSGYYMIVAEKAGVGRGEVRLFLPADRGARVVVMLSPVRPPPPPPPAPGTLSGRVVTISPTTNTPAPVAGARVRVFPVPNIPTPTPPPAVREGRTDDRGMFGFEGLRPGRYLVVADKEGVGEGRSTAILTETAGARVEVLIPRR